MAPPDTTPMQEALALAHGAIGLSEPNPRVGCVITAPDGRVPRVLSISSCARRAASVRWRAMSASDRCWPCMRARAIMPSDNTRKATSASNRLEPRW